MLETLWRLPDIAATPQQRDRKDWAPLLYPLTITAAIALGWLIRAVHVLSEDFPLNDGGLFYAMVRDLQQARYALPAFTSYNGAGIPFGYPPLGFYVAGLLADITPLSLFDVFRFLPLTVNCLTIVAFFLLARSMVSSRAAVAVAVFAFALIPRTFIWLLMGGGVTRSLGFLFALLALQQAYLLYTRRQSRFVAPATLCAGLTILSHAETGWFLAFSIALFFLAYGRHRHGLLSSLVVAGGTIAITAPWWVTLLAYHGVEPLLAATRTGGSIFSDSGVRNYVLLSLARFVATSEPFFPLLGTLALLGALACLASKRFLLPTWWAAIILLDARAFPTFTTVPVAMLAGIGVAHVLLPVLDRLPADKSSTPQADPPLDGDREVPALAAGRPRRWAPVLVLAFFVCYATIAALTTRPGLAGEGAFLVSLSDDERAAMSWVARETPPSSRFLVIPDSSWPTAKAAEWFPVLADRVSVATVQGSEWLPDDAFTRQVRAYDGAHECGYRGTTCLESWSLETEITFTHVYVAKTGSGQCCWTLLTSLDEDPRYDLIYDGPGATIFARQSQGAVAPSGYGRRGHR